MKLTPRWVRIPLLALLAMAAAYLALPKLSEVATIRCSGDERAVKNVCFDTEMPEHQEQALLATIKQARERVATLYGEDLSYPLMIAGYTQATPEEGMQNARATVHSTPLGVYVVLEGLDFDALVRALARAELATRIGWWAGRQRLPTWFEEGLVGQLRRWGYGREPQTEAQRDAALTRLSGLSRPEAFYEGRISRNYLLAGQEVRYWLDVVGQEGLLDFLEKIRGGMDFFEAYRATERRYQN